MTQQQKQDQHQKMAEAIVEGVVLNTIGAILRSTPGYDLATWMDRHRTEIREQAVREMMDYEDGSISQADWMRVQHEREEQAERAITSVIERNARR